MISSPKHRIGPLLSLSAGLAAVLAVEIVAGPFFVPEAPPVSSGPKNTVVSPRESPAEKPAISTFAEVVMRPLFTPTRRPKPPSTESKVIASAPKDETFDLIGVIISADQRMALLRTRATSEVLRASEGQSIGGWEVRAIKPTQIVLRRGNDDEVLKINDVAEPPVVNDHSVSSSPAKPPPPETSAGEVPAE